MLKWSLAQLYKLCNRNPMHFEDIINFQDRIENIDDILEMTDVKVTGTCTHIIDDRYQFEMNLQCVMTLECARTLEPVPYPIDMDVLEIFDTYQVDEDDETILIEKSTIDLTDVIWENVYLEKPMRVFKEGTSAIVEDHIPDEFYEESGDDK